MKKQQLNAGTSVWAAGVRGSKLMEESFEGVKRGRIVTKQDLTINGYDNIFVIGDCSAFIPAGEERPLPTYIYKLQCNKRRKVLAKNIKRISNGESTEEFEYVIVEPFVL